MQLVGGFDNFFPADHSGGRIYPQVQLEAAPACLGNVKQHNDQMPLDLLANQTHKSTNTKTTLGHIAIDQHGTPSCDFKVVLLDENYPAHPSALGESTVHMHQTNLSSSQFTAMHQGGLRHLRTGLLPHSVLEHPVQPGEKLLSVLLLCKLLAVGV